MRNNRFKIYPDAASLADKVISPFLKNRWSSGETTVMGVAQVHSSYLNRIKSAASDNHKLLTSLIMEVGKRDRINLSDGLLNVSLKGAYHENALAEYLGDISLVEELNDFSDVEQIVRAAIKLNFPVHISAISGGETRSVRVNEDHILVRTDDKDAKTIMEHKGSVKKHWV